MLKMMDYPNWRATRVIGLASTFLLLIGSRRVSLVYGTQLILLRFYLECSGYTHKKCSLYVHKNTFQETTATVGYTTLFDVYVFCQIACLCAVSCSHLLPIPQTAQYFFLLCLLIICKYGRVGKYIKSSSPKCLTQKTTIFAVPMLLWIVFFPHICIPSVFFFVSLLFQERATKVVRSSQGYDFLFPVPFALVKFWSFRCSVP